MRKKVLITGANGELGKVVVQKLHDEGFQVGAVVRNIQQAGFSGSVNTYQAEITRPESVERLISQVQADFGCLDAAVLLAGGFGMSDLKSLKPADWQNMLHKNFDSALYMAQAAFNQMLSQETGGKIIMIGAKPALEPGSGKAVAAYALSKSLLFQLSDLINAEGKKKHIVSTVIVPSIIDTLPNRKAMPEADFNHWVKPGEIADAIAFICSKGSGWRNNIIKIYGNS
ncbi:MAG: SDR family NAD(P)-dependent oxidoreductase [Candidatus Cyclobacteriaceae bacterium M3_2C_046]